MSSLLQEKEERHKVLAEFLLKDDKRVYIRTYRDDLFFGDILFVGETRIEIQCFSPKSKAGKKFCIYWVEIDILREYMDREEKKDGI